MSRVLPEVLSQLLTMFVNLLLQVTYVSTNILYPAFANRYNQHIENR